MRHDLIIPIATAAFFAFILPEATLAQDGPPTDNSKGQAAPAERSQPDAARTDSSGDYPRDAATHGLDIDYDDERPLDWPERQWRWYTRHVRPHRFARRDLHARYGYTPPFGAYRRNYFGGGYYGGYPYYDYPGYGAYDPPADTYIQGRYDQRQFQEWKESHDKGLNAYAAAMSEGLERFRETAYAEAVGAFVRAAELNQGDPAARLHAAYALVAIGNYEDAVLMVRRAIQLQSRLLYLPLSIREEYGPQVDFDAHLERLRKAASEADEDPGLWMLLGYYECFSGNRPAATEALTKAQKLAPRDPLINDFLRAARLLTPSHQQSRPDVHRDKEAESE
jgi:hypothetical protein